ncbi:hypothetical protein RvY_18045 [Ramazzottius varieornatus]|uniref:Ubiquitin-conjugating enzyme E2 Z n=1 Tax=Ramazzottius varieornatus TaxID=947166 RepID=A0A1D1W4C2_RAMVA|nr:hypothetical protein RvY_18045 [Ramazzottius varieornatus]
MPRVYAKRKMADVGATELSDSEAESSKPSSSKKKYPTRSASSARKAVAAAPAKKVAQVPRKQAPPPKKNVKVEVPKKEDKPATTITTSVKKSILKIPKGMIDLDSSDESSDEMSLESTITPTVQFTPSATPFNPFQHAMTMFPTSFGSAHGYSNWDPRASSDWDKVEPTAMCKKRMQHDLANSLSEEEVLKIYVHPNEEDITKLTALVIGPSETPYEGGFFLFYVRVPPEYPLKPPRVVNLTTGDNTVQFGPNLYDSGKVCLSILGTWTGPSWSAAMTLSVTLTSIQSLMSVGAMRNEPGDEDTPMNSPRLIAYDRSVRYKTIRVAILDNLDRALHNDQTTFPEKFRQAMFQSFLRTCDNLMSVCVVEHEQRTAHLAEKVNKLSEKKTEWTMDEDEDEDSDMSDTDDYDEDDDDYGYDGSGDGGRDWMALKGKLEEMKQRVRAELGLSA